VNETGAASIRYEFLDWLRVIAIFVLLFFHTGMLFVGWHFHIQNAEVIEGLQRPMDLSHRLRMPLLFVIAGAGLWFAFRRRTASGLMKERTMRLLVPVLLGMLIIVPPQIYVERLFRGQWDAGYVQFFIDRVLQFEPYPQGNFSWHHLWFIVYLFVYVPLLLPLLIALKRAKRVASPGLWLFALALPLGLNEALLKPVFPESHDLINDWYVFIHYLLLTAYGLLLASMPQVWDWLSERRGRTLTVAILITVGGLSVLDTGIVLRDTPMDAFIANAFTWSWLLAFLAYGRRYLSIDNALLRWAREASYPIYILHQTVMLIIAYWVIAQPWSAWMKFAAVLSATIVICVVLYEGVIRRFYLTRLMFGMKLDARPITTSRISESANVIQ
jgi:glucans biosynthesis protein C